MPRDYKSEYQNYQSSTAQKKARARRNAARRKMMQKGKARKGDGLDVAHMDNNTKNNSDANLKMQKPSKNRSFPRTKTAKRKK